MSSIRCDDKSDAMCRSKFRDNDYMTYVKTTKPAPCESELSMVVEVDEKAERAALKKRTKRPKRAEVRAPTILQKIFRTRNQKNSQYYLTDAKGFDRSQVRDVIQEPSPYQYPKGHVEPSFREFTRALHKNRHEVEVKQKCYQRPSYRTRQQLDRLSRLYVEEPEIKGLMTIEDIDPEFYKVVEGRPVEEKRTNTREYIHTIRQVLRTKLQTGYKEDEVLLMEERCRAEQKAISAIKDDYRTYVDSFEKFLFEDHTTSMSLIRLAEIAVQDSAALALTVKSLSKEYGLIKSQVYVLEEKWRNLKIYQKFLYQISPLSWRKDHDYYMRRKMKPGSKCDTGVYSSDSSVFGRYRLASTGDILSLENLIDMFVQDIEGQDAPKMYFNEPKELLKVFRYMELQNLNSLIHLEELALPMQIITEGMRTTQRKFEVEVKKLQDTIDSLAGGISWEEQRAKDLEVMATSLINGELKRLLSDPEFINMNVFVEDAYEACIAPNDSNLSEYEMMKGLEMEYGRLLLSLDYIPPDIVQKVEKECYAEEERVLRLASEASKKVQLIDRLTHRLIHTLDPPVERTQRDLKWRSPPYEPYVPPPPPPRALTEEEQDYLIFFTDYCHRTDTVEQFGIKLN